ncbi:hypothetical protein EMWEY_00017630 [Eimeria maxima]|uniref:Uncharacterized protein n=1 Tax=Eimeria maxima TaxID=5804 RepID=U6M6P1_EIMMA|nr:hypothetical protein EMWEY_00017630 [Eimeria maxima]CDJ58733.1 hypothetical protein EMWEY_00017630 [Eimeria maxima]
MPVQAYTYHVLLLLDAAAACSGAILLADSVRAVVSYEPTLHRGASKNEQATVVLIGIAAFLVMIFANMPYSVMEYTKVYADNFGGAIASAGKHIKAKVQGAQRT